jgi:hypothetical protein
MQASNGRVSSLPPRTSSGEASKGREPGPDLPGGRACGRPSQLEIAQRPRVQEQAGIDLSRVLEICASDDCQEMRRWLRSTDALTDEQLHDSFHRVRERLQRAYHGAPGRVARLAVGTGIGAIPGIGLAAGVAFGALDSFLLEHVVREPGPYSFLSHRYLSIFRGS